MPSLTGEIIESAHAVEVVWTFVAPVGMALAAAAVADAAADWRLASRSGAYREQRMIVARGRAVAAVWDAVAQACLVAYAAVLAASDVVPYDNPPQAVLALRWLLVAAQVAVIAALIARRVERWRLLALFDREGGHS